MRFVIVSRAENVSGKEIMTLELGSGLREAGHKVSYVTSIWNDGGYQSRLCELGFEFRQLPLGAISATLRLHCLAATAGQLLRLPRLWSEYRQVLRSNPPDCVLHTSWHHLLLLWPLLSRKRDWFWAHEVLPDKPQYRWLFRRLARTICGFVAVSQAVRNALVQLGVPPEQVAVVHNGLQDLNPNGTGSRRDQGVVRIGIVGQVEEWKGHHNLLAAFSRLGGNTQHAEIHVYGSGSSVYRNRLRQQAADIGIEDKICWRGFMLDRAKIYQELDLCVIPIPSSANEALPTVAIEAGFFGLPVVASRRGGLVEIIADGVTGLLVEAGNVDQLSLRLQELVNDAGLRERLGRAARHHVKRCFGRERFVADFLRLMQNQHVTSVAK
ncbi:MAG: glycosyltransferase family 4 protein [Verrucomicrobiaceae bacterium]